MMALLWVQLFLKLSIPLFLLQLKLIIWLRSLKVDNLLTTVSKRLKCVQNKFTKKQVKSYVRTYCVNILDLKDHQDLGRIASIKIQMSTERTYIQNFSCPPSMQSISLIIEKIKKMIKKWKIFWCLDTKRSLLSVWNLLLQMIQKYMQENKTYKYQRKMWMNKFMLQEKVRMNKGSSKRSKKVSQIDQMILESN